MCAKSQQSDDAARPHRATPRTPIAHIVRSYTGPARPGPARPSPAQPSPARPGPARPGPARPGPGPGPGPGTYRHRAGP
jgi:hypothetical protein